MASIQQRLLHAEAQLISAFSNTGDLAAFEESWSQLLEDIDSAINTRTIDEATLSFAQRTATTIMALAETLLQLDEHAQSLSSALTADVESILRSQDKNVVDPVPDPVPSRRNVSYAAKWLAKNYHNPYPSTLIRDDISRRAKWDRTDVDAWFIEARRRIGWTKINKRFFPKRRAEMIRIATEYFTGVGLSLTPQLELEFRTMEARVKELYVEPFTESKIAQSLDAVISQKFSREPKLPYPSPESSPTPSLSSFTGDDSSTFVITASRKRGRSNDSIDDEITKRPQKRLRCGNPSTFHPGQNSLPSPIPSDRDSDRQNARYNLENSAILPKRKRGRRASDSDAQILPQHPSTRTRTNRLQTVSDPIAAPNCVAAPSATPGPSTVSNSPPTPERSLFTPVSEHVGVQDKSTEREDPFNLPCFSFGSSPAVPLENLAFNFDIPACESNLLESKQSSEEQSFSQCTSTEPGIDSVIMPTINTNTFSFDGVPNTLANIPLNADDLDSFFLNISRQDQTSDDSFGPLPTTPSLGVESVASRGDANLPPLDISSYLEFASSSTFPVPSYSQYQQEAPVSGQSYSVSNTALLQDAFLALSPAAASLQASDSMSVFPLQTADPFISTSHFSQIPTQCDVSIHQFSVQDMSSSVQAPFNISTFHPPRNDAGAMSTLMYTPTASMPAANVARSVELPKKRKSKTDLQMRLSLLLQEVDKVKTAIAQDDGN